MASVLYRAHRSKLDDFRLTTMPWWTQDNTSEIEVEIEVMLSH